MKQKIKGWIAMIIVALGCIFVFPLLHLGSIVNVILAGYTGAFLHTRGWSILNVFKTADQTATTSTTKQ